MGEDLGSWCQRWRSFESEGFEEMVEGGEDEVCGDGPHVGEEARPGSKLGHGVAPRGFGQLADGMAGEGEQVEGGENGGKVLAAVAKVSAAMKIRA